MNLAAATEYTTANKKSAYNNIYHYLKSDIDIVEDIITQMDTQVPEIMHVMMHHILNAGGKRIRPILTLAITRLLGKDIHPSTHALAASVELIHTATLLHDDVMDDAEIRRHKDTSHVRFGNIMSILFGDFLLVRSLQQMLIKNDVTVMKLIAKTCSDMIQGEIRQLTTRHQWQLSFDMYIQIIGEKTASLFQTACQLGALAQDASPKILEQVRTLGYHIGILFQITDDIKDYTYTKTGKTPGIDFFDGKITMPIIVAVQQNIEVPFWKRIMQQNQRDQTDLATAIACLQTNGILIQCKEMSLTHMYSAIKIIKGISGDATIKQYLSDFVQSMGDYAL